MKKPKAPYRGPVVFECPECEERQAVIPNKLKTHSCSKCFTVVSLRDLYRQNKILYPPARVEVEEVLEIRGPLAFVG